MRVICARRYSTHQRVNCAVSQSTRLALNRSRLTVKPVGEPDAGDRHVRFDERLEPDLDVVSNRGLATDAISADAGTPMDQI
jgi:hypothetical protein